MEVDLDIHWPSGLHESYRRVAGNRLVTFREGAGVVPNRGWSR
jgi:hypothetical protein